MSLFGLCTGPIPLVNEGSILPSLTILGLSNNSSILPSLTILGLSNNSLSRKIPASIFTRPTLQQLLLDMNNLSGPIDEFSNASATLTDVDLSSNQLTGAIPTSFSQLKALQVLVLHSNNFTGTVDLNPYLRLTNLDTFSASYNPLLSATADDLSSNTSSYGSINTLELSSCNLTRVPSALRYLPDLQNLDLSSNHIGGKIPDWIWRNMLSWDLSHNQFTTVGQLPANTSIGILDLSFNNLRGPVPFPFAVGDVDYSNNKFTTLPSTGFIRLLKTSATIYLSNNKLTGPLPYVECDREDYEPQVQFLDLSGNKLSGVIPPYLLKGCNGLTVLNLRGNHFNGTWPDKLDASCHLEFINLHGNRIRGRLPRSLSNCKYLQALDVGGNSFVDSFPSWLGHLASLRLIILRSNKFYGNLSVPVDKNHKTTGYFHSLQIIDLAGNRFVGVLPQELFDSFNSMVLGPKPNHRRRFGSTVQFQDTLDAVDGGGLPRHVAVEISMKQQYRWMPEISTDLVVVDLFDNRFSGAIPRTIGNLTALVVLNMSRNDFTGEIPGELGRLSQLESLDLSWNRLTGEIPRELAALSALEVLNLSYNDLSGSIPWGTQLCTFPSSSFQGRNRGLSYGFGCNLTRSSSPWEVADEALAADRRFETVMLCLFVGLGYGVGFALAIVLQAVCLCRRKYQAHEN
ncbi:hypothetical protein ACP4OV_014996 [Aristida adscensionis]